VGLYQSQQPSRSEQKDRHSPRRDLETRFAFRSNQRFHYGETRQVCHEALPFARPTFRSCIDPVRILTGLSLRYSAHLYPFDPEEHGHLLDEDVEDDSKPSKELVDSEDDEK